MKFLLKFTSIILLLTLFYSCNSPGSNASNAQGEIIEEPEYRLEEFGISIQWTAYKFVEKIGVSGKFCDFTIHKRKSSGTIENILNDLQLTIPTESLVTENAIRDFKIKTYFFGIIGTPSINGTILTAKNGEGDIKLEMNNVSNTTRYTYSLENDTIVLFTHLDLKKWKGEEAIAELNKEWYGVYKGPDGVGNVWMDVDVSIRIPVNRHRPISEELQSRDFAQEKTSLNE